MKFCPICKNILIPKNKSSYCKVCERNYKINPKWDEYTIIKVINHVHNEQSSNIIKASSKSVQISSQIRKAYEDFF
ncbi:MAG: hypothetical protein ACFFDF_14285 [Candidatus Odinarchaeota archaeon]